MQALISIIGEITPWTPLWNLLNMSRYSQHVYHSNGTPSIFFFLWEAYGCVLSCSIKSAYQFKWGLMTNFFVLPPPHPPPTHLHVPGLSSQVGVSRQYLVRESFLLLMAWPPSQFREVIKAVWWRSWSCTMSLTDARLSKTWNAQLVAFIGAINMH